MKWIASGLTVLLVACGLSLAQISDTFTPVTSPGNVRALKRYFIALLDADPVEDAVCSPNPSRGIGPTGNVWDCNGHWHQLASGGAGAPNYSQAITAVTTVSLTHNLGTRDLIVQCFDSAEQLVEPNTIVIGASTPFNVTVTFAQPQSGRCVINGSP